MTSPADRELVQAIIQRGDEQAFRTLYRRHTPALYRMAVRLMEDRDGSAEDMVQDTWLRAADRWEAFAWKSTLGTWLAGILLNRIREARRAWSRQAIDPLCDDVPDFRFAPGARLDLAEAVAALPAGYRAAIVLHDIEGFRHEEIATLLGIDVGTSKSQLSRARQALRRWLEPGWSPA